jgi:hypothetical protein
MRGEAPVIEIRGVDQLFRLSKALKAAGDRGLQRDMSAGLAQSMQTFPVAMRRAARRLPNRGGFAGRVANTPVTVTRTAKGARVQVRSPYDLNLIDKGVLFHPIFGRDDWVRQSVRPGVVSQPVKEQAPKLRRKANHVLDQVAAKIERAV